MRQIEVINQETIIDVSAEVTNVEILVTNYDDDLVEKFALEAQQAAIAAEASATAASESADEAAQDAIVATNQALLASAARLNAQNAANAASASEDAAALSASSALASATSAELDAIATAADRVQTGLDRQATGADRVQTGLDRIATGADRVQTGIDANTATTQAGVATTQAGIATTQAGIATTQAGNALTSANNALNSANAAAASAASAAQVGTSTLLTGFATGANTTILGTDSILGAFQKAQGQINARVSGTGVSGQVAFWSGTGTQTGDSGLNWNNTNKLLSLTHPTGGLPLLISNGRTSGTNDIFRASESSANLQTYNLQIGGGVVRYVATWLGGTGINMSHVWQNATLAGAVNSNMQLFSTGNLLIQNGGTFTDAGFRLDVNGTARVQGNLTTNLTQGSVPFIGASGLLTQNNSNLFYNNSNGRLGLGTNAPESFLHIVGTSTAFTGITLEQTDTTLVLDQPVGELRFKQADLAAPGTPAIFGAYADGNNGEVGFRFFTGVGNSPVDRFRINAAGNILINTATDIASSILTIESTTKGFLPPRMTSAQRNAIASPATGLMVYNTTDNRPSFFNGTSWINL